jgi:hypothetical protein
MFAIVLVAFAADSDRLLKIETARGLPTFAEFAIYHSADVKPGQALPKKTVRRLTDLKETVTLPDDGPFDVYAVPKSGLPVRVVYKLSIASGNTHALKLGGVIGVVEVFGDNLPRAEAVVITATDDPGPGEKGHKPVQIAKDYRVEMAVPEGTYAVWVVPTNGARAVKVNDNIRVLAGRSTRVE